MKGKSSKIRIAIVGATGYSGFELLRLLSKHPQAEIKAAVGKESVGKSLSEVFPTVLDLPIVALDSVNFNEIDLAFFCLPHGENAGHIVELANKFLLAGAKVIDLGDTFRISDSEVFQKWHQMPHVAPQLLNEFIYGIPELHADAIKGSRCVANPGCYPTSILLPLAPLLKGNLVGKGSLVIDSKSGVSGAGRKASTPLLYVEAAENVTPYAVGRSHRHIAEIQDNLNLYSSSSMPVPFVFTPHLVPVRQGLLSTIYVPLNEGVDAQHVRSCLIEFYKASAFVRILPEGRVASMRHAIGTNLCVISVSHVENMAIICSAIDNLYKGSAGQAIQNMNLMFGLSETEGLQ
jgi:N-acetyl-gamma-glutamyl-phosphate reductase